MRTVYRRGRWPMMTNLSGVIRQPFGLSVAGENLGDEAPPPPPIPEVSEGDWSPQALRQAAQEYEARAKAAEGRALAARGILSGQEQLTKVVATLIAAALFFLLAKKLWEWIRG